MKKIKPQITPIIDSKDLYEITNDDIKKMRKKLHKKKKKKVKIKNIDKKKKMKKAKKHKFKYKHKFKSKFMRKLAKMFNIDLKSKLKINITDKSIQSLVFFLITLIGAIKSAFGNSSIDKINGDSN